jgi:anti-sigma factor RsiW
MDLWAHHRNRRLVSAYLDGELDAPTAAVVGRHVARCWACNSALEELRLIKASLRQLAGRRPEALGAVRLRRWAVTLSSRRPD